MNQSLSESEIQRITQSVRDELGGQSDAAKIDRVVRSVADSSKIGDSLSKPGIAARRPMAKTEVEPPSVKRSRSNAGSEVHFKLEDEESNGTRIIIASFGRNRPGVAAALTGVIAECGCDIFDITQKIMQEFFSMIMIVELSNSNVDFATLRQKLQEIESRLGITVVAQHQDVFRAMHRI